MIWECEKYNWSSFRAMVDATLVPHALQRFQSCTIEQDIDQAYWLIDNNVIVQGSLYEAALPTAACLVIALASTSTIARPKILELLQQIGSGSPDPTEIAIGNTSLKQSCLRELAKGLALYFSILENGTVEERVLCIDILGLCATADSSLIEQVVWYYGRIRSLELGESVNKLIDGWSKEIKPDA